MRYIKKIFSLFLVSSILLISTACGKVDKSWALKYDNNTVSNGVYVYFLWIAYNNALKIVSNGTEDIYDLENQKVEGKDAASWIKENAIKGAKDMLATEKLFEENGLTISEEENKKINEETEKSFENSKETFDKYGVTLEDFKRAYATQNLKSEKLFNHLYNKGGTEAVSDEDLRNYYKTNYVNVSIISKSSETNPEEDGNTQQNDEEKKSAEQIEEQFKNYVNMINNNEKTFEEIGAMFKESEKMEEDPIINETLDPKAGDILDEVSNKIKELEINKSTYVKLDDMFLLIYKKDINTILSNLDDEEERYKVLIEMKSDDFNNLLKNKAEDLKIKVNESSIKDYNPTNFFKE